MPSVKVLLVAQNMTFEHNISRSLNSAGYQVMWACKREEVLPLMYDTRPDLILVALNDMAGDPWELLKKIRLFTNIPILVIADHFTASDLESGASVGVTEFLSVPARPLHSDQQVGHQPRRRARRKRSPGRIGCLTRDHLSEIDHALADENTQEVWITKHGGRVRFIAGIKSQELESVRV